LLETMIAGYDDGRSRSFFCRAAALLDPVALGRSLDQAKKTMEAAGRTRDRPEKAKALRGFLVEAALSQGIDLTATK
ncbi:MAG TPA: hypothetical protein VLF95_05440, partial [Vicinamibacteria bacterium]|nr:hypothetical protein [Vicinamibacteria bacterium]